MHTLRELRRDSRHLVRELGLLSERNDELDIGYAQGHVLLELEEEGALSIAEAADRLALDISTSSRLINQLRKSGLIQLKEDEIDRRRKLALLSEEGRKKIEEIHRVTDRRVQRVVSRLSEEDLDTVVRGFSIYAAALNRERSSRELEYRPIRPSDSSVIKSIIVSVSREYGTDGEGGPTADPELNDVCRAYSPPGSRYWVAVRRGRVLGGGGIAPLKGAAEGVCELQKLYLLPEARGIGAGSKLLELCFDAARKLGYKTCYIETTKIMGRARKLYEKAGCLPTDSPLGETGHHQCECRYVKEL